MVPTDRDLNTNNTTATLDAPITTKSDPRSIECPECGNTKVARARRHGMNRIYSCRTHTCKARFYRFGNTGR
jgi:predicted RNA-binding Zn-ribbon protein involved in translation (DUF1610 family)